MAYKVIHSGFPADGAPTKAEIETKGALLYPAPDGSVYAYGAFAYTLDIVEEAPGDFDVVITRRPLTFQEYRASEDEYGRRARQAVNEAQTARFIGSGG